MASRTGSPALPRGFSREATVYLRPVGVLSGAAAHAAVEAGSARRLAGGRLAFGACEVLLREGDGVSACRASLADVIDWAATLDGPPAARVAGLLERIVTPRAPFAGLALDTPRVMGVINVTPDSFSDGGDFADAGTAIAEGLAMRAAGADILDVGGESTRPGSDPVSPDRECARVLPVIEALAAAGATVSIDSRRATVMRAALAAGAAIINDVSALTSDPDSPAVVAAAGAPVVLMHMLGEPKTMQRDPVYADAPLDIYDTLEARIAACEAAGIPRRRIAVDPGIGFGKTLDHNLAILRDIGVFHGLGCALLLGASRKSFIARIAGEATPKERVAGSLAAALAGLDRGVQILRVHDVAETAQALAVWRAITD